jgi:hypothetical protein
MPLGFGSRRSIVARQVSVNSCHYILPEVEESSSPPRCTSLSTVPCPSPPCHYGSNTVKVSNPANFPLIPATIICLQFKKVHPCRVSRAYYLFTAHSRHAVGLRISSEDRSPQSFHSSPPHYSVPNLKKVHPRRVARAYYLFTAHSRHAAGPQISSKYRSPSSFVHPCHILRSRTSWQCISAALHEPVICSLSIPAMPLGLEYRVCIENRQVSVHPRHIILSRT